MKSKIKTITALAMLLFVAGNAFGAAGGTGASVKDWGSRSFEALKEMNKPIIIYFYDAKQKNNHVAEKFEGKDLLLNSDIADRLKKFVCVKIATDAKDWPAQYLAYGTGGAGVMVWSSDKKRSEIITKDESAKINSAYLVKIMDGMIEQFEKEAKEAKEAKKVADKKEKEEKKEEKKDVGLGGIKLPGADDNEKKDPKAPAAPPKASGGKKIVDE
jgi:hypothetical protein